MALPWDKAILSGEMVLKTWILLHSVGAFFFFWQNTDFWKWQESCAAELKQPNHVICLPEYDNFSPNSHHPLLDLKDTYIYLTKFQVFQNVYSFFLKAYESGREIHYHKAIALKIPLDTYLDF